MSRGLAETILAAAQQFGADEATPAIRGDNEEIDVLLDASIAEGRALAGPDTGSPVIVTRTGEDSSGRWYHQHHPAPTPKLWDAYCALTEIDGVWEIKRGRTGPPIIPGNKEFQKHRVQLRGTLPPSRHRGKHEEMDRGPLLH